MIETVTNIAILLVAGFLAFLFPGILWQVLFGDAVTDPLQRLVDAIGLSLSLSSLLAMAAFFIGLWFPQVRLAHVIVGGGLLALAVMLRRVRLLGGQTGVHSQSASVQTSASTDQFIESVPAGMFYEGAPGTASDPVVVLRGRLKTRPAARYQLIKVHRAHPAFVIIALAVVGVLLFWRLYQVRALVLPAWVDSLHHVLIVRLFLENGGVPATFEPYMSVPFYYHFGFHGSTALFALLSGLDPAKSVLVVGQALNALVALSVYRLGLSLWGDRRRAGIAGLLVGFVSHMPAYYATWGRYTLIAGLVLLPLAMSAAIEITGKGADRSRLARLIVLTGGLVLAHYFSALLFGLFLLVLTVYILVIAYQSRKPLIRSVLQPLWAGVVGAGLLTAPWLWRVWGYARPYTTVTTVSPSQNLDSIYFTDYLGYLWYLMGPTRNYILLILALFGLALAGLRLRTRVLTFWTAALAVLSLPWGPKLSPFRPDHAVIVLFLPASLLIADGLVTAADRVRTGCLAYFARVLTAAVVIGLLIWGVSETRQIINPQTVIAKPGDLRAIRWVDENLPPDARFYINVVPWQGGLYRGVDGGWWLLPLAGRETLVPPGMYLLGDADYVARVNAWAARASQLDGCGPAFRELVRSARLGYIYFGVNPGNLRPADLEGCENLQLIYDQDGVAIYQVLEG